MPFTPYHFGPSGFIGLVFRKWLDFPVFVLANVIVDVEVLVVMLFDLGWPRHRYCHTLLIGAAAGALWGLAAWPLRNLFKKLMKLFRIPYKTNLLKMLISGILGLWLHILIDGAYHFDVKILWPNKIISIWRMIHHYLGQGKIQTICLIFFPAALVAYIFAVRSFSKNSRLQNEPGDK
ncbi:MAG TPA: hypothetical protein VMW72_17835 [Sedimentisphaerales bacterium]|nr:hypothetical protein [Sedimentisphaerales bacterium]